MMKKKLAVLGLGVLLSATMLAPVNASERATKGREGSIAKTRITKAFSMEDKSEWMQGSLDKLEQAFEDGTLSEEDYTVKKERLEKIIEALENGEMPEGLMKQKIGKKGDFARKGFDELTMEEKLAKVDDMLAGLQEKYDAGSIDEERYNANIAKFEDMRTKIENGEAVFVRKAKGLFDNKAGFAELTKEEKLAKVDDMLAGLQEKYDAGSIDEERYNDTKAKFEDMRTKIENGEAVFVRKAKGLFDNKAGFAELTKEEKLAKVDGMLAGLQEKYDNGSVDEERYNNAKTKIEEMRTKIENDEPIFEKGRNVILKKEAGFLKFSKEEQLAKIDNLLLGLTEKYDNGDIDQEYYDNAKAKYEELRTKIENGESIFEGIKDRIGKLKGQKGDFKKLTKEEMETKISEKMTHLDEKLANGDIDQDKYDAYVARINAALEKMEEQE